MTCAERGCSTRLSRYNPGPTCWAHKLDLVDKEWRDKLTEDEAEAHRSGAWLETPRVITMHEYRESVGRQRSRSGAWMGRSA